MNHRQSFLKVLILSAAGAISKILGAIPDSLARLIGAEGIGLYQMAYPIYHYPALATAGVPVAISILIARKETQGFPGEPPHSAGIPVAFSRIRIASDPAGNGFG